MSILAKSRVLSGIKTLLETGELLTPPLRLQRPEQPQASPPEPIWTR
jgi:hypothetical protein